MRLGLRHGSPLVTARQVTGQYGVIYAPAALTDLPSAHIAKHRPGDDPGRWLFGDGSRPAAPGTIGPMWRKARTKAACDGIHRHHLRHFYASGLIAAGCDVVTVQRALGHSSASITLNVYSHLWPSAEDRTRRAAARIASEVLNPADYLRTSGDA